MTNPPGWQVSVGNSRSPSRRFRAVVRYSATITSDLEQSHIALDSSIPRPVLLAAISPAPEWNTRPWEPPSTSSDRDLLTCAMRKLLALFEFGSVVPGSSAKEIRAALDSTLGVTLGAGDRTQLKRFEVTARILDNGQASWDYAIPTVGEWAPGFPPKRVAEAKASSLDVMLQGLVRADLHQRLES